MPVIMNAPILEGSTDSRSLILKYMHGNALVTRLLDGKKTISIAIVTSQDNSYLYQISPDGKIRLALKAAKENGFYKIAKECFELQLMRDWNSGYVHMPTLPTGNHRGVSGGAVSAPEVA